MSCCTNTQPMISNSVNIGINPGNINCSSMRVNIPLNYCKRLTIYGRVINNCNGSSVPYAKLQLLKQDQCSGCYRCVSTTTADSRGMYCFNLCFHRFSGGSNYKIVASAPYDLNQIRPRSNNQCVVNCPQEGSNYSSCCGDNYNDYGINTTDHTEQGSCHNMDYSSNYNSYDFDNTSYATPLQEEGYSQGRCGAGRSCGQNGGYTNIQELQDSCPNYQYGYLQNICSSSSQGNCCGQKNNCCSKPQCGISNFWND